MKKLLIAALAAVLAMSLLTACGGSSKTRNAAEDESTSAPTATAETTEEPTDEPSADEGEAADAALQTAEEAANDQVTIQNEIDSIKALIEEGLYDDAAMQARALLTKNLTDADKALIQQYMDQIQSNLGGLTD